MRTYIAPNIITLEAQQQVPTPVHVEYCVTVVKTQQLDFLFERARAAVRGVM